MEPLQVLLWAIGAVFGLNLALRSFMWHRLNYRFDKLDQEIEKLDKKLTDIDRILCRIEGAFFHKNCHAIKDAAQLRNTSE
jgi:hypothetical protein